MKAKQSSEIGVLSFFGDINATNAHFYAQNESNGLYCRFYNGLPGDITTAAVQYYSRKELGVM